MVGAAAAVTFPAVRDLAPQVPSIESYPGEHWKLVGGAVMAPVFRIADWVQYITIAVAFVAFTFARWPGKGTRFSKLSLTRAIVLFGILGLSSYQAIILHPRMDRNLQTLWAAATSSDNATAQSAKAAFDADHGPARRVLEGSLGLALLAAILAGCSVARAKHPEKPA